MSWNVHLRCFDFPASAVMPTHIVVDRLDLYWAAVTVGRPNLAAAMAHGGHSTAETIWRCGVVDACVAMRSGWAGLHDSPAYVALDATEKAWINFLLGMLMTKIFADRIFGTPWLHHFKWFQGHANVVMMPGLSTPDFVGVHPQTGTHSIFEAKGRAKGLSSSVLQKAKAQVQRPLLINGQPPVSRVGGLLHRVAGSRLAMAMIDPDAWDGPVQELFDTRRTWQEYYAGAWHLSMSDRVDRERLRASHGLTVGFAPAAAPHVARLMDPLERDWRDARAALLEWSSTYGQESISAGHSGERVFADGTMIGVEPFAERD